MATTATDSHPFGRWTETRSKLANTIKLDPAADVTDLRRQLRAERLADHIKRTVDAAPALTMEQRERLAALLRGGDRIA